MSTMMLPTATVNSQPACSTDFILLGACGAQGMTAFRKNLKTVENVYYVLFFVFLNILRSNLGLQL